MDNKYLIIKQYAYRLFEKKGHKHGHDLDDWLMAEKKIKGFWWFFNKERLFWYDLLISIIAGIISAAIVASISYWFITSINPNKVFLCLNYAYTHNYEKATAEDPIKVISTNKPVLVKQGQKLYLAILNTNLSSVEDCTLHLVFEKGFGIKPDVQWQEQVPNEKYAYIFYTSINNRLVSGALSLVIEFPKEKKPVYTVKYDITGKNMKLKSSYFLISQDI